MSNDGKRRRDPTFVRHYLGSSFIWKEGSTQKKTQFLKHMVESRRYTTRTSNDMYINLSVFSKLMEMLNNQWPRTVLVEFTLHTLRDDP